MNTSLPEHVRSLFQEVQGLSSEDQRRFYWALQNPSQVPRPAEADAQPPPGNHHDAWQVFTLADAYQTRPPVEYIVARMFALPSLNIVYGAPGTFKSFLLADLAVCAASGQPWLTPAPWLRENHTQGTPTRRSPVMWIDFDNGRRRTHDRFSALGRARQLPPDTPLYYYSMPTPWLDAGDQRAIGALALRMHERDVRLLIVDNLGVVSGDADENSADMGKVMSEWRQLAEDTQAAIILIHHQRKSNGMLGRAGDSLRGHSSIEAALDLALMVEREDLADTIAIRGTKVRGEDVLPFSVVFTHAASPLTGEIETARFYSVTGDDNSSSGAIEREILNALFNTTLNKTELTRIVRAQLERVGVNRIRDMIDRMASAGKLNISSGRNNTERLYSRP